MPIRIKCSGCGKTLLAPDRLAGKQVPCPVCKVPLVISAAAGAGSLPFGSADLSRAEPEQRAVPRPGESRTAPASAASADNSDSGGYGVAPISSPAGRGKSSPSVSPETAANLAAVRPAAGGETGRDKPSLGVAAAAGATHSIGPTAPSGARSSTGLRSATGQHSSTGAAGSLSSTAAARRRAFPRNAARAGLPASSAFVYWLLLAALFPLAVSSFFRPADLEERFAKTVMEHKVDVESLKDKSFEQVIESFPGHKLIGAHLARDSWLHWLYALLSGAAFLSILLAAFPNRDAGLKPVLWSALGTATVGILMLFCVQWIAELLQGTWVTGRGVVALAVLVLKFIGYSYRSALDADAGFLQSFAGFTFGVGLCEELCKAIPVVILLRDDRRVDWRAAALVGMASGVGFAVAEGIIYSADFYNGIATGWTYLVRFTSCVSLHAIWAGAVALLMYGNQDYLGGEDFDWLTACNFVLNYLAIAMVLHGLYDTLLKMQHDGWALAVAAASFAWLTWLVHRYRKAA